MAIGGLLVAATFAAQPAQSAWRDDSAPDRNAPDRNAPDRIDGESRPPAGWAQPPADNGQLPGNPDDSDFNQSPRRLRSRDPDGSPPPRIERIPYHPRRHHRPEGERSREEQLPEREQMQRKLTSRFANPAVVRLVQSMSPEQSVQLYLEVSGLIDARHLKPSSYDARVKHAAKDLCQALENRAFLEANGLQDPARIDSFRRDAVQLAEGRPITGADDAYQALQWTIEAAGRDAGLRPAAIALEFVFGATDSLDKYSAFVPAMGGGRRNSPSAELEDHIVGIGVEIKADEHGMLIANALPGGPAAEAGLKGGDVIEAVDGQKVSGTTLESAVDLITGPAGSRVTLTVRRDDHVADVGLVRRRVEVHSVSDVRMLDRNVGYIKLEKFAQNSSEEVDKALWDLYQQGMKSVVVDVRGNPGGLLTTAIQLSNKFVPAGAIVATRGRDSSDNMIEYARRDRTWKIPLVVLVDENSASASEIFAAAVQENGRGLIVGRRTYGKGTVQTHFPLQTVSGNLRLTTAQFFSPKGRTMAGEGVNPDITVAAEHAGENADFEHAAPDSHDLSYEHHRFDERDEFHHHEAAFRHGGHRRASSHEPDRDIAAAVEAATSEQVFDLAQSAGTRRNGDATMQPPGR